MPNGDYSLSPEDWEKIRAFFEELSPILFGFAAARNLEIDKYYHDSPSWTFCFRHPKGGAAGIHVERISDSEIRIGRDWYIDDFDKFTRYLKSDAGFQLNLREIDLSNILEQAVKDIVTWNKGDMIAHPDYEKFWSQYSREEWLQMSPVERLPKPKL
jgi:hypothetical protein